MTDPKNQSAKLSSLEPVASNNEIVLYTSYIGPNGGVAEGRIIKRRKFKQALLTDSRWRNVRRALFTLMNRERKGIAYTLTMGEFTARGRTDNEGYFKCALPATAATGWQAVTVHAAGTEVTAPCLVLNSQLVPNSQLPMVGIISDLDDTLLVSEVTKKIKLISNAIFKNALQRRAVEGAATCFQQWAAQHPHTPVFYLSATPRQLYSVVHSFFLHHQFPQGMIITRRLSFDKQGDPLNVRAYKTAKIEQIFTALPHVKFRLVGDDGEHDPDIYHDIQTRYPHQVDSVWIRRVSGAPLKYSHHQAFAG
jgi:phosphatidate phosphatase APP1